MNTVNTNKVVACTHMKGKKSLLVPVSDGCFKCSECGEIYVPFHKTILDGIANNFGISYDQVTISYSENNIYQSKKAYKADDVYCDGTVLNRKDRVIFKDFDIVIIIFRDGFGISKIDIVINSEKSIKDIVDNKLGKYIDYLKLL